MCQFGEVSGAAGSGAKAISLLARIQAGQQITTVDDLYKKLVLEEPETMATADAVVSVPELDLDLVVPISRGEGTEVVAVTPVLWSPQNPKLYRVETRFRSGKPPGHAARPGRSPSPR